MKKLLIVLPLLVMIFMAGCSSPTSDSSTKDENNSTPTPPQPTEDLVLAAENEYGIAYIYLPESDETNIAKSLGSSGKPLATSNAEYRIEFVKTITRKSEVTDTISTHGDFAGFGNLCNNLKIYKVFVSRSVTETEFYISSNAYINKAEAGKIFYKLTKVNGKWYMSTMLFDTSVLPSTFTDGSVPQFTDDYEDAAN